MALSVNLQAEIILLPEIIGRTLTLLLNIPIYMMKTARSIK